MTTPSQLFKRAKEIIQDEASWTKKCNARDVEGNEVPIMDEKATRWCARGALGKASRELTDRSEPSPTAWGHIFQVVETTPYNCGLIAFNDRIDTTHESVLAMFDEFIREAEAEERYA